MKKTVLTMIIFLFTTNVYAECEIRVRVTTSAPFYFKDSNTNWTGFIVEQAKALVAETGCEVAYRVSPWGRALRLLEEGELDMMGLMSITEERKKYLNFIGPHFFENMQLLVPVNSNYKINKHEDLKNLPKKVVLIGGAWYGKEIDNLLKDNSFKKKMVFISGGNELTNTLEKIRLGRVSGYMLAKVPGMTKLEQYKGLKYHPFVINSNPVYFGLSKKSVNPILLKRLQDALERIKAKGEFERILKEYE